METLGTLLRELRRRRGLTQEGLAARAMVTARAVRYWEADRQQPRDVELENVLGALAVTPQERALAVTPQERAQALALLTDRRNARLSRAAEAAGSVPTAVLGPLPGVGDLLRAMRARRGWTQERLAEEIRVSRATVIRWEATRTLPSEEDVGRLCGLLRAAPGERAALQSGRLSLDSGPRSLTLEECREQFERLMRLRGGSGEGGELADLHLLALKQQVRSLLGQSPEALRLLADVEVHHAWWLTMQGRAAEACAGNWRALNLVRGKFAPEDFWLRALNLLSAHAAAGARGPEGGVRLLYPWLRLLPASLHPILLCDMALYAGRAQRHEEAAHFLQRARQGLPDCPPARAGEHHFRLTTARVLVSGGQPVEALAWLPPPGPAGDGRAHELLIWAETYLAAGERNAASRCLSEARDVLTQTPLPARREKLELLAQRL